MSNGQLFFVNVYSWIVQEMLLFRVRLPVDHELGSEDVVVSAGTHPGR